MYNGILPIEFVDTGESMKLFLTVTLSNEVSFTRGASHTQDHLPTGVPHDQIANPYPSRRCQRTTEPAQDIMSRTLGESAVDEYRCYKKLSPQAISGPKLVSKPQSSPVRHLPTASGRPASAPALFHGSGPALPTDVDSERRTPDNSVGPSGTAGQLSLSIGSLGGSYVEKTSVKKRVRGLSEGDVTQLLRRYDCSEEDTWRLYAVART